MHRNKQKKGISTIIAALFTVAVIIVGLNVMIYSSSLQNNFGQVEVQKNLKATERISEQLQLTGATIKNNKFNITLYNTGSLPVHLVRMWVTNNTGTNTNWHQSWNLTSNNYILNPRNATRNIGQSLTPTLYAKTGTTYTFGFVTERGTIATYKLAGGSDAQLSAQLVAYPPTIPAGEQVTIQMLVQNNSTLADSVANITPTLPTVTVSPSNGGSYQLASGPTPASYPSIVKGSSAAFTWSYKLTGSNGTIFTFSAGLANSQSNTASTSASLYAVQLSSTTYAVNAGVLTLNYTSFKWTQNDGVWHSNWSINSGTALTGFRIDIANNNSTGDLWLSKYSAIVVGQVGSASTSPWFIVNLVTPATNLNQCSSSFNGMPLGTKLPCTYGYGGCLPVGSTDYCQVIPAGQKVSVYAAATVINGNTPQNIGGNAGTQYLVQTLMIGRFCATGLSSVCSAGAGTSYAQNIPFIALVGT